MKVALYSRSPHSPMKLPIYLRKSKGILNLLGICVTTERVRNLVDTKTVVGAPRSGETWLDMVNCIG